MKSAGSILPAESFKPYVDAFNADDVEDVIQAIPNAEAYAWMAANVPRFNCPDQTIEEIYYYRWWTFRKHIRETPDGLVVTEFILPVKHAGPHNTISCALCLQIAEGRWLADPKYISEYTQFWFRGNEGKAQPHLHKYSQWTSKAVWDRYAQSGDASEMLGLLDDFVADYELWETEKQLPNGLFWQFDVRDGMEESISGSRKQKNPRPTINSYMYVSARTIADIAKMAGKPEIEQRFREKAAALKKLTQEQLWDPAAKFFKVMFEDGSLSDAREAIGFIPWCFDLPDAGYEEAWEQLIDPQGFWAPFGITTAERRHPKFRSHGVGRCEWDGAVWPFCTTQTLDALANVLRHYKQNAVTREHYLESMHIYAMSHHRNGKPYLGEYLDEMNGEWLKGDNPRSRYYNHSTFCDLVITGLVGLVPRTDSTVEIDPLLPEGRWDYFCLEDVPYHGRKLTIVWDRDGTRYGRGEGLSVFADGARIGHSSTLQRLTAPLG